jgi:hypothetical protein
MFNLNEERRAIRDGVAAVCKRFGDDYWVACEKDERFPTEFHRAMATDGWLGVTMPEKFGGAGLGVTEAAIVMHTVASHGGGMAAASSIHINMFGPHPMVVHGNPEQQAQWIPRLVEGKDQVCFGVTEPDAGLDTTSITTFAKKVEGGYRVTGRKMWTYRAGRRSRYDQHHDLRQEGRRRISRDRAEDVDLDGAGRQQDPAVDADLAEADQGQDHRGDDAVLYGPRSDQDRREAHSQARPRRGRFQRRFHR